jgi:hypothetical protein
MDLIEDGGALADEPFTHPVQRPQIKLVDRGRGAAVTLWTHSRGSESRVRRSPSAAKPVVSCLS